MTTTETPKQVRTASALLVGYGVLVVAYASVLQVAAGWVEARDFPRALIRLAGTLLMAWGLRAGHGWAWWLAVVLGGFWEMMGVMALVTLPLAGGWRALPYPAFSFAMIAAMVVVLGAALVLLLHPASRAAFRDAPNPRAPRAG